MSYDKPYAVGETLICTQYVERKDGRSRLNVGDKVEVLQEFQFSHDGKPCQDITVQHDHDMPIAVMVAPGRFRRP